MVKKLIKIELEHDIYNLLKETVERREISFENGLREAIRQWVETQTKLSEDPLFKVKPVCTGVKTDSSRLEHY